MPSHRVDHITLTRLINNAHAANAAGDFEAALKHTRRVLKFDPTQPEALYNQGLAQRGLQQFTKAIETQKKLAALCQQNPDALNAVGLELCELDAQVEAEQCLNRALALNPNHPLALSNKANLLQRQRRYSEAETCLRRAATLLPEFAPILLNLGAVLNRQTRFAEAIPVLTQAISADPEQPEAWNNLANAHSSLRHFAEAEQAYQRALALKPNFPEALANLGDIFRETRRYPEAAATYAALFEHAPNFDFLKGRLLYSQMQCCDWRQFDTLRPSIDQDVRKGRKAADPFGYQALAESPHDLRRCAEIHAHEHFPAQANPIAERPRMRHDKIRIGYLSGEFHTQATAILMAGVYEHHDKSRFSIIAFDNGRSDNSPLRQRLEQAFDQIASIADLSDTAAAECIAAHEIDLLINLNGYFGKGRQGVFAHRPSPIQINYLGFPGTLGAPYMDYLIADRHVLPAADYPAYCEKIAWLPDTYQANDNARPHPDHDTPTREAAGLPAEGFVFCCFNNSYKITPRRFALWMRILQRVPGSLLWLLEDNTVASAHLRTAAGQHGIAPERIVFAPRASQTEHLARHRLADLFLDTLPYNAHTTAADALWMGLPVLTQTGPTFPGRVAGSLLKAIDLPELITASEAEYETQAVAFAQNTELRSTIREKLARQRLRAPLFDSARFTRHLEAAYATMFERLHAGLPPDHFAVESLP